MSNQQQAYEGADKIKSDPIGLWSRANRNHWQKQDRIIQATAADPGELVLEVGSGHGLHTSRYAERFDVTAIDLSRSLVDATRAKCKRCRCFQADARDLPFPDGTFRAVVGTAIAHHLPDLERALSEWLRVIEDGGSVTLAEPNYLFPKDLLTAHLVEEERHKTQMAPWRVQAVLERLECSQWSVAPFNYTPPWPAPLEPLWDRIDDVGARLPVLRWSAQMLLIHIEK